MADKGEKKEKTEKAETTTGSDLKNAVIEQAINELTRPLVKKISPATIEMFRKMGIDKVLPVISVGLQTVLKDKLGSKTADVIAEVSAELRRVIMEGPEEGQRSTAPIAGGVEKMAFSVIFNHEIAEQTASLIDAWAELFKNDSGEERPEKEKKQIISLIGQMGPSELFVFLTQEKDARGKTIDSFIKKTSEKTFDEAVKEFKEDVKKLVANAKTIYTEILAPVGQKIKSGFEEVDNKFAETEPLGKAIVSFREAAKKFRDDRRKK